MAQAVKAYWRMFASILLVILGVEVVVMMVLSALPPMPPLVFDFVDGLSLAILSAPLLWLIVAKPLALGVETEKLRHEARVASILETSVDERKRAEADLRLQGAALNAAGNAIVITDRNGTIVWTNQAFSTLTGYSAKEAIGENPRNLVKSGVQDQAFYKNLWDTILAGNVWQGEITNRRKDGSLYPEDQTITPVRDDRGEITHFIAIRRDLTEEKQLQSQFLQAQKMDAVGQLAGGVAHDFNNLLTVIMSYSSLLLEEIESADPRHGEVQEISDAAQRGAGLTGQLLAFSRKQVMQSRPISVNSVVLGVEKLLRRLIGEDIELATTLEQHLALINADSGQLEQVIINLAVNARDAMPNGGRLHITTANTDLSQEHSDRHLDATPGPYVMLALSDTGMGMTRDVQLRVFEPFFTTKGQGKGTGLGLSTVYGIVKQSGGDLWVYSEPGKGTTFKVYFPRLDGRGVIASSAVESAPVTHGNETILIVEDDAALRSLTARILKESGYTVLLARNGVEALALATGHEGNIDMVATDVVMPLMSGRPLVEKLSESRSDIKVLFMSGYTDDEIMRRGVLDGRTAFLQKPFTPTQFANKVRAVLDHPITREAARTQ